jgi:hypothetical protein
MLLKRWRKKVGDFTRIHILDSGIPGCALASMIAMGVGNLAFQTRIGQEPEKIPRCNATSLRHGGTTAISNASGMEFAKTKA